MGTSNQWGGELQDEFKVMSDFDLFELLEYF